MKRACSVYGCLHYSDGTDPYCPAHQTAANRHRNKRRHHTRQQRLASGNRAAQRMRATIVAQHRQRGALTPCAHCHQLYTPDQIQIDHITPLHQHGTDTDNNVQPLCIPCHKTKTRTDKGGPHA